MSSLEWIAKDLSLNAVPHILESSQVEFEKSKLQANATVLEFGSVGWHLDADTQAVPRMIANGSRTFRTP